MCLKIGLPKWVCFFSVVKKNKPPILSNFERHCWRMWNLKTKMFDHWLKHGLILANFFPIQILGLSDLAHDPPSGIKHQLRIVLPLRDHTPNRGFFTGFWGISHPSETSDPTQLLVHGYNQDWSNGWYGWSNCFVGCIGFISQHVMFSILRPKIPPLVLKSQKCVFPCLYLAGRWQSRKGLQGVHLKHTRAHSQDHIIHPGGSCLNRNCWDGPGFHVSCYDNTLKIMADCVIQHILLDLVKVLDLKIFARKSEIIYEQVIEQKSLLKRMFRYIDICMYKINMYILVGHRTYMNILSQCVS